MKDNDLEEISKDLEVLEAEMLKAIPQSTQTEDISTTIDLENIYQHIDSKFSDIVMMQSMIADLEKKNNELHEQLNKEREEKNQALVSLKKKYVETQKLKTAFNKVCMESSQTKYNVDFTDSQETTLQMKLQQAIQVIEQQRKIIMQLKLYYKNSLLSIQSTLKEF